MTNEDINLMCGECFGNTFVIVLAFVKYANTEEEKSYLVNSEKPDDFYCFALYSSSSLFYYSVMYFDTS